MNFLDILFGIPLLWFAYKGFNKGFVIEIISLLALFGGIYIAVHFSYYVGGFLEENFDMKEDTLSLASFAITFILVVLGVHLLGRVVEKMVNAVSLGFANKLAGGAFGMLKVAFIISVVLYLYKNIDTEMKLIPEETREESLLFDPVASIAPFAIPKLKEEKSVLEQKIDQLEDIEIETPSKELRNRD